ncbi:hypothetical protein [Paenibacillus roseipurpureus]|uniref:Uncharacterized protein n=1 Tax=Paenibacillus roseopurpureus TaxID=2918901 RepID=A0AA96LVL7_9BACL|nr:hypothetical protein [Paenibacillus sp. MBLB1832]WNR46899.1 hypothetical protein MJB10_12665 [Paenibacillus sp. MBLB1832]
MSIKPETNQKKMQQVNHAKDQDDNKPNQNSSREKKKHKNQ